jgi:hypothetical protein
MPITLLSLGEGGQILRERVRERPKVNSRMPSAMSRAPAPRSLPNQGLAPVKGRWAGVPGEPCGPDPPPPLVNPSLEPDMPPGCVAAVVVLVAVVLVVARLVVVTVVVGLWVVLRPVVVVVGPLVVIGVVVIGVVVVGCVVVVVVVGRVVVVVGAVVVVVVGASVVIVVGASVVVVVVAASVVVVGGAVVVVVVVGALVVVVGGASVVVVGGASVVVVVVVLVSQSGVVKVLSSRETWPLRASARPLTTVPVVTEIDVNAMIVPTKVDVVPSVAELPTCQNT